MEYGLWPLYRSLCMCMARVLILVLMEYGLWQYVGKYANMIDKS